MTDEEFVRSVYPHAGAVMMNKGLYDVREYGEDGNKMRGGVRLSGQYKRKSEAWKDAAERIRETTMNSEARELKAFLDAIARDPRDLLTRHAYADWLLERGDDDLAAEQRNFSVEKYDAEQYLQRFADRYADGDLEGLIEGLRNGRYCFDSDDGPDNARWDDELWKCLAVLTGETFAQEHRDEARFNCSC